MKNFINKMTISYVNLKSQYVKEKGLINKIKKVLKSGNFILNEELANFEKSISKYCNKKFAIGLNSGTDALTLGLKLVGVGKGDEVITPPNSFISSSSSIVHLGAKPKFVDVLPDQNIDPNLIENSITSKTKAIMPVHLSGRICEMDKIIKISKKYKIPIIEDAAQSIGSKYKNNPSGSFGLISCFSTHPLKNLNACGDGGFIVTDDKFYYEKAKMLRNNGFIDRNIVKQFAYLSRLDEMQAAILNYRLKNLNKLIKIRRNNAKFYFKNLNRKNIYFPDEETYQYNSYHTFVIQIKNRNKVAKKLKTVGVETSIHYPIPIHLQPAAKFLNYKKGQFPVCEAQAKKILTLPINQYLTQKQLTRICKILNKLTNEK